MSFSLTRRAVLQQSAMIGTSMMFPQPLLASLGGLPEPVPPIEDPRLKELTAICLDAARQYGAAYADVRLTHTFSFSNGKGDQESMSISVRALVDGYWGFAASPLWSSDEAARLGRAAVLQAKANTLGLVRPVEMAPKPNGQSGHWTMPIKDDPFAINRDEMMDFFGGLREFTKEYGRARLNFKTAEYWKRSQISCWKQEKAFSSSDGQYCTQRLYRTSGLITLEVGHIVRNVEGLTPAGLGYEHVRDQPLRERIAQTLHEMDADVTLPIKPVDVGRHDMVFDASTTAHIVSQTVGAATEADRALGYEANAGGTSYLTEPVDMLGTFCVGSSRMTVSGNRTLAGGAATVAWDDEGVPAKEFTLIDQGMIVNLQTSREGAGWIKNALQRTGLPFQSTACMTTPDALYVPVVHTANLQLHPGQGTHTRDTLCETMRDGLLLQFGNIEMDFQQLSGYGIGEVWEVKGGKRVAAIAAASILFRTPELWKSIQQAGGALSVQRYGIAATKGEPQQTTYHTVSAPPILCKEITVIDSLRKA